MNSRRIATIGVAGGALAAWLAAAGTSSVRTLPPPVITRTPVEKSGAELAAEIAKLRERLRPSTSPRREGRNLFQYNAARPAVAGHLRTAAAGRPAAATPAAPPPPAMQLAGLAEDSGPDGPIRTAIISTGGDVFLAREGDMVTSRFRVARIAPDVVELIDLTTNEPIRLALR